MAYISELETRSWVVLDTWVVMFSPLGFLGWTIMKHTAWWAVTVASTEGRCGIMNSPRTANQGSKPLLENQASLGGKGANGTWKP